VIGLEKLQQLLDLLGAEPADVALIVDVAGRGPDQHLPNIPGAFCAASTAIMLLTECPTKTATFNPNSRPISITLSA
jgi:hypothetical protein